MSLVIRRAIIAAAIFLTASIAHADYRGYWVEAFRTPLGTRAELDNVVRVAVRSKVNALFVQVRRRGDSWYLDSVEPLTEVAGVGEPDATGRWTFDPLRYLLDRAHANGIEVHAFTIVGAVYREDPKEKLPTDPNHVFLRHIWDASRNAPYDDERQWATRAIGPNRSGTTYDGQRFGSDWYIDLGHPEAAAYTINVLAHLVARYDIDGLHLDRVRYPEGPIDRRAREAFGANVGYNRTSVERFNARYGRSGWPKSNDPQWNAWRREQVTTFVRALYRTVKRIRPNLQVSAALITYGAAPTKSQRFEQTEAYWRVFQDWQLWAREEIIDVLSPMNYKREKSRVQARQFDDWNRFLVRTARGSGRRAVVGIAAYLNSVDGTIRQARRANAAGVDGVLFFALSSADQRLIEALRRANLRRTAIVASGPGVNASASR